MILYTGRPNAEDIKKPNSLQGQYLNRQEVQ